MKNPIPALLLLVALGAGPARADAQKEAEQEMAQAQAALDQNDYPTALQHFSAAQTLAPQASGPLLGLGLTYAAIDRCQEAVPLLVEYRRRKGPTANPKAERTIEDCQKRPGTGTLVLETRPSGVDVTRDTQGQPFVGKTPLVVELPVGRHTLLLRKPGYFMSTVTVQIRPGKETRELAGLRSETTAPDEEPVATKPTKPVEPATTTTPPTAAKPEPTTTRSDLTATPPEKKSRTGLYVGIGVGVGVVVIVAVAVGAALGTRPKATQFDQILFPATQP